MTACKADRDREFLLLHVAVLLVINHVQRVTSPKGVPAVVRAE
jgi:hypothetical protein